MPWDKSPEDRRRDAQRYGPEWRKARQAALARAGGRCEQCGSRRALQVDHIIPVSQGGTHGLGNLQVLCSGPGSCHARKTAAEGGGYRSRGKTAADPPLAPRTSW